MKTKVFLDTNVLIDVLAGSRKYSPSSRVIFELIKRGQIEAVLTTQSVLDASYAIRHSFDHEAFSALVNWCCNHINMDSIDTFDLRWACRRSSDDFEDDAQYSHALESGCDIIVTGDKEFISRYSQTGIQPEFFTPDEFVNSIREA